MVECPQAPEGGSSLKSESPREPLKECIFFIALNSVSYRSPTNEALEILKQLDKTDYSNPETLIRAMGIQDEATQYKIRRCCQAIEEGDAMTIDNEEEVIAFEDMYEEAELPSVKDKSHERKMSFSTLKTMLKEKFPLDNVSFKKLSTIWTSEKLKADAVVDIGAMDDDRPSIVDMRDVRNLIEKARNTWVFFNKELIAENNEFFENAVNFEEVERVKLPTQIIPMETEILWYMANLKSMGATVVLHSPTLYNSKVGNFMKQIGIVQGHENPEPFYCTNPQNQDTSAFVEFLKRHTQKFSRVVFVDNILRDLGSNSRPVKTLLSDTQVDLIHYSRFLSLTTPHLLGLQNKVVRRYPT